MEITPIQSAIIATTVGVATTLLTGSLLIGAVAAAALVLISRLFAPTNPSCFEFFAKRDGFVWFYKKEENPTTALLGNFHIAPLTYRDRTYQCAEAAFQAQKFDRNPERMREFENLDGHQAWQLAQSNQPTDDESKNKWFKRSLTVMSEVLQAKFKDPILRSSLLSTGSAYLVEHLPKKGRDNFWGDDHDGTGQNQLGNILMDVRAKLGGTGRVDPPAKYWKTVTNLR